MTHPLFARLIEQGIPLLDEVGFRAHIDRTPYSVLFFSGDPQRFPESLDVAVVLPELLKAFPQLQAALMTAPLETRLQADYAFTLWPTLVFLRQGQYLGSLSRILNWSEYQQHIAEILTRAPHIPLRALDTPAISNACSESTTEAPR